MKNHNQLSSVHHDSTKCAAGIEKVLDGTGVEKLFKIPKYSK